MISIITGFFTGNIKVIIYFLIASMIATAGWKLYSIIEENSRFQAHIAILEHNNHVKQNQIDSLREAFRLTNELVNDRDKKLRSLEERMRGITDNLGDDADDQAADSLKEYFKRLAQ